MRRLLLVLAAAALLLPGAALAHPLGNFTVNRYAGIELSGNRVYVEYSLDLAEIPTLQERARFRRPGIAAELGRRLRVVVDGRRAALRALDSQVALRPGAAGLKTLRFDAVYDAGPSGRALEFRDGNYAERLGWKEVVVHASRGARLVSSTAPARSISNELRSYPRDLLRDPADTTSADGVGRAG